MKKTFLGFMHTIWWSPLVTNVFSFVVLIGAIPYLTYDFHHSHVLYFTEISLGAAIFPHLLAKLHRTSNLVVFLLQILTTLGIYFAWPKEQLGNWNIQIADHIMGMFLVGFLSCAISQAIALLRLKRSLAHSNLRST